MARGLLRPPDAMLWLAGVVLIDLWIVISCSEISDFGLGPITTIENVIVMHTSAKPAPVVNTQEEPVVEIITMLGHDGQRYNCELPLLVDDEDLPLDEDDENDWIVDEEEQSTAAANDLANSLSDIYGNYRVQDIVQVLNDKSESPRAKNDDQARDAEDDSALREESESEPESLKDSKSGVVDEEQDDDDKDRDKDKHEDEDEDEDEDHPSSFLPKAEKIVESIRQRAQASAPSCLQKQEGYWVYEVCLGKEVRQYHQTKDVHGKSISKRNPDWSLGTFMKSRPQKLDARAQLGKLSGPELVEVLNSYGIKANGLLEKSDLVDEIMDKIILSNPEKHIQRKSRITVPKGIKKERRYPVVYGFEEYIDGQHCDETGSGRSTTVQFACEPKLGGDDGFYIAQVEEVEICTYVITIGTQALCQWNRKSPQKVPPKPTNKKMKKTGRSEDIPRPPPGTAADLLYTIAGECFEFNEGWWTYELCVGMYIRQYHKEVDSISQEYFLGKFVPETYPPKGSKAYKRLVNKEPGVEKGKPGQNTAIVQKYKGGEACDLTGSTREAEVQFVCGTHGPEAIESIREVRSCVYVLSFRTHRLCSHKLFKPQQNKVNSINCYPVIEDTSESDSIEFIDDDDDGDQTCEEQETCSSDLGASAESKAHEEEL